jgi:LacI family transcriptional regulator
MADGHGKRDRVTIRAVAEEAGVSVAAVSKVLRNAYGVSDALRQKVQAAIDRLGYRPNVAARGMRGQTFTIGILMNDLTNPFLADLVDGVSAVLAPAGYKSLIGVGRAMEPLETGLIDSMIDYRMDGLVLIAPRLGPETLARYAPQIPFVNIGHHEPAATGFDTVNSDDRRGAQMVVEALLARGHRDIGMISLDLQTPHRSNVSDIREDGYLAAMAAAGLSDRVRIDRMHLNPLPFDGELRAWLAASDRPRAVFCWSDLHGVQLLNLAAETGINVPEDLAVAGYDNSRTAALPLVGLASVDQSGTAMGATAAELLLTRIAGRRSAVHALVPPTLITRRSL